MKRRVLSVTEAASRLNRCPATIRVWITKGVLPADKVRGRYRISEKEVGNMKMLDRPKEAKATQHKERSVLIGRLAEIMRAASVNETDIVRDRLKDRRSEEMRADCY